MSQLRLICLSLTPNLRCIGFTLGQFETLIIPPAAEVIISLLFIFLSSGPGRWAQILLAADSILYFIWALLDMLSHVLPVARNSLFVFKVIDLFVGAVSFTPILIYSTYLYLLCYRDIIPILPRKLQPYLEFSLPILMLGSVAINEASSFVGTYIGTSSSHSLDIGIIHNAVSLWKALNWSSLAVSGFTQFLFFLLAFSRLSTAFLDQRRIELTHSDERHFFNGIAWITAGISIGIIETIVGFARISFAVVLARRILRLVARAILMYGLLKGLDVSENFENLTNELRGLSRFSRRISRMLGVNPQRSSMFRRISRTNSEQTSRADELSQAEKQSTNPRVTVHYEKGQAPFLQIRFSTFDFPAQAILADTIRSRRWSLPGLVLGRAGAGNSAQQGGDGSDDMTVARNEPPRVKSAMVLSNRHVLSDWIQPPEKSHTRQGSGGSVSDTLSIVRDLERRFPSLPPRVTGKYRGSILGENYEEDLYPVVGVSRQSSLRHDGPSEEGGASLLPRSSGSIKRKPAPPLLENITYNSDRRNRKASTWGGLIQTRADSPVLPNSPREEATDISSDPTLAESPSTPRSRKTTARDMIKRASKAWSDASIRSAEWLASASSPRSARTPVTPTDIEMYRRGDLGPGTTHSQFVVGEAPSSGENFLPKGRRISADDATTDPNPSSPRIGIGVAPMRRTPTPTRANLESGRERVVSYVSVDLQDDAQLKAS